MSLNNLDFLIYSSHKTSTQTLLAVIKSNNMKSVHCHRLFHLKQLLHDTIVNDTNINEIFIQSLITPTGKKNDTNF